MNSQEVVENLRGAIKAKKLEKIKRALLENQDILKPALSTIDSRDNDNLTNRNSLLWEAILNGNEETVQLLVDFGADPDEPYFFEKNEFFGLTFVQSLAKRPTIENNCKRVAEILIRHGANVDAYLNDSSQKTALIEAIERSNVECIAFYLSNGAKFNSQFFRSIFTALKIKQPEILELLLKYNQLEFKYHDERNRNYLHITVSEAYTNPNSDINVLKIAKFFLNCGIPIDEVDDRGQTPLFCAIGSKNFDLVNFLIAKGASVTKKTNKGFFPLYLAAQFDDEKIMKLLLSHGAEINDKINVGFTALHRACSNRCEKTINLLIENGADFSIKNQNGETPYACLLPRPSEIHKESSTLSIILMIKEIAKRTFFKDHTVCTQDLAIIRTCKNAQNYFENCIKELNQMASFKFYPPYSFISVLTMSKKKMKKLKNLTKNQDFVSSFEGGLNLFIIYGNNLKKILNAAIELRDRSLIVEVRLNMIFGDFFPEIVKRKLTNHLRVEDLPLREVSLLQDM